MKKYGKILSAILLICTLLPGCSQETPVLPNMVVGVDIQGIHNQVPIERHYRDSAKTVHILNYLRLLKYRGGTDLDPHMLPGDDYTITIQFSQGAPKTYEIQGGRYLQRPGGTWERVDSSLAARLPIILEALDTDL